MNEMKWGRRRVGEKRLASRIHQCLRLGWLKMKLVRITPPPIQVRQKQNRSI